jgi:hypothetical protein
VSYLSFFVRMAVALKVPSFSTHHPTRAGRLFRPPASRVRILHHGITASRQLS